MDFYMVITTAALALILVLGFCGFIPLAYAYNLKKSVTPKKYREVCIISFGVVYIFFTFVGYVFEGKSLANIFAIVFWTFIFYKIGLRIIRKRGFLDDGKSVMLANENNEVCPFCATGVSRNMKFCPSCGYDLKTHFENNLLSEHQQEKKKNGCRKLIITGVILIVVLSAALIFMYRTEGETAEIINNDVVYDDRTELVTKDENVVVIEDDPEESAEVAEEVPSIESKEEEPLPEEEVYIDEEREEEIKEILPVLTVSETEVTVTDSATIYVACESADGEDYVISCDYRGSEIDVEWGKKEGNTSPLIIAPYDKGEYEIKLFLKDKPEIYKIIKIHAQ